MRKSFVAPLAALLATACTVGPNYHPPETAVPAAFAAPQPAPAPGATIDPARWWTAFGDPTLDGLVTRALKDSPDITIAASRVRQARLQEIAAGAVGKPTVNASGNVSHVEFSKNAGFASLARLFSGGSSGGGSGSGSTGGVALPGSGITTYALGFDASWELDLFGGGRRGVQAAAARADAATWNQRDAAVMLAAEVAQAYFALRLDQEQLAIGEQELTRERRAQEIAAHVAQVGLSPQVDVSRQRAALTTLEARLQPVRADAQVRIHALGILLGAQPESLIGELQQPSSALGATPVIPAGLPSDLLRRRPDVRAAERQLAAATADIGVAVADLYPKFSLTGMVQLLSASLGNLFSTDSIQATGSAGVSFPLLDWGRRKATVGMRKEDRVQAYARYQQTVLGALRDVEDALVRIDAERARNATLRRAVDDTARVAHGADAQFRTGLVAQDIVLTAENQALVAREQLAASDAQLRQDTASLFKAIGGGWSEEEGASAPSH
jgi:NodT family efflux transporter outer membrane factor (OMF) lipoprotein